MTKHDTSLFDHDHLLVGLFTAQPAAALYALCGGNEKALKQGIGILRGIRTRPLDVVSDDDLLSWCDQQPQNRYPEIASLITSFQEPNSNEPPRWTTRALRFLEKAPDQQAILRKFTLQFMPRVGWSRSLAAILESNARLLDQLGEFPGLIDDVYRQREQVRRWVEEQPRRENALDRGCDERFE